MWDYTTTDTTGPGGDLFGMLVDGVRTQLSDVGGPISQSGLVTVHASTSFGWFINCTDCIEGPAIARITNFTAAVPAPGSLALFALGLAGLGIVRRRSA